MNKRSLIVALLLLPAIGNSAELEKYDIRDGSDYSEKPNRSEEVFNLNKDEDKRIGSIFFSYGTHELTPKQISQVADIAQTIIDRWSDPDLLGAKYRLKIIGFSDADGNSQYNLQLGLLRAEAVAKMLEKLRVPMQHAVVASHGKAGAYYKSPKFRRVEIWLESTASETNQLLLYGLVFFILLIVLGGGFYLIVINSGKRWV